MKCTTVYRSPLRSFFFFSKNRLLNWEGSKCSIQQGEVIPGVAVYVNRVSNSVVFTRCAVAEALTRPIKMLQSEKEKKHE